MAGRVYDALCGGKSEPYKVPLPVVYLGATARSRKSSERAVFLKWTLSGVRRLTATVAAGRLMKRGARLHVYAAGCRGGAPAATFIGEGAPVVMAVAGASAWTLEHDDLQTFLVHRSLSAGGGAVELWRWAVMLRKRSLRGSAAGGIECDRDRAVDAMVRAIAPSAHDRLRLAARVVAG